MYGSWSLVDNVSCVETYSELIHIASMDMPIWNVPPPDIEPVAMLVIWRVFETNLGTRHFVGFDPIAEEGRVSSAIVGLDTDGACGSTSSGRVYRLEGPPGDHPDAAATWADWARHNGVTRASDVTELLFGKGPPPP